MSKEISDTELVASQCGHKPSQAIQTPSFGEGVQRSIIDDCYSADLLRPGSSGPVPKP